MTLTAPGGGADAAAPHRDRYRAKVEITEHGIPHITAADFGSLGYGSGYAAAQASICTLADTLVTARGERSRWFGPKHRYNDQVTLEASNLQVDAFVTDLHDRRVVEKLLADPLAGPGQAGTRDGGRLRRRRQPVPARHRRTASPTPPATAPAT